MENNETRKFDIRDIRKSPFLWISQKTFTTLAKADPVALKVYCYLASRAGNKDQHTWCSSAEISRFCCISQRHVFRALKTLKKFKLIQVIPPRDSGYNVNNYLLID